ncbi:hypothetical protein FEM55_08540 [Dyadobacter sediminis]|uniref:Na+-driven multidrug efflux pump n=3 Tax=Dyadobacter sediminis TaxID=1493691 RepID=A0A5R9KDR5_9BACT|nr:hypothetical protein FEM55_08540 [Dyadobacter sediminis]
MKSAQKVVLNTGILYSRMLITIGITFYTTREVLNALGATDYGIYNLIAGVIAMLSFLNAAMSTSTQRYLSFHQSNADKNVLKSIFSTSLLLHICIGFILVSGIELSGLYLFNGFLNIPSERLQTARTVYHFMSMSVFFTIVSVPFTASLNSNENMLGLSVVNIIEVVLKLIIAISINGYHGDRLILYGLSMACISFISLIMYVIYCNSHYEECTLRLKKHTNLGIIKNLTSFAGWNLFGALTGIGKTQGVAILLNVFFGTSINAAYGIANQVSSQMNFFSATMLKAINPRIMKTEGQGNRLQMLRLAMMASKFGYFLLAFVAIPCIFEMDNILNFWLKSVPPYTSSFCSLILVAIMVNQLTVGLDSAIQAIGKIKNYMIVAGTIKLLIVPVGYLLLKSGLPPIYVIVGYTVFEGIAGIARLKLLEITGGLNIKEYIKNVYAGILPPTLTIISSLYFVVSVSNSPYRLFYNIPFSITIFFISIYYWGLCKDEKQIVDNLIANASKRLHLRWI